MKDQTKKIGCILCAVLALAGALAGCGSSSSTAATAGTYTVQVTAVDGSSITGAIGTLSEGEAGGAPAEMPQGEANSDSGTTPPAAPTGSGDGATGAPEKPNGDATTGEAPTGDAPQMPQGEAPTGDGAAPGENAESGTTPPDAPTGSGDGTTPPELPGGGMGGHGGSSFTAGEEPLTFTVTDATAITLEFMQGSTDGTLSDIAVGAVLEVTVDATGNATAITVRNLQAGGGFGGSSEVTNGTAATTIAEDSTITNESYTSGGDDENALRIDGAAVVLTDITVEKTGGESSNTENGDFYGQNAALLALNGATVNISGGTVTTDAVNGNAVFSYGEGTTVNISGSTIRTAQRNSGGIQTTGGGTTNAENLDVQTEGQSSAAIRSDRGGGTVNVTGGTYTTNGTGSPAIYCTANISATGAVLAANASEGVVVEGKNNVALTNCTVTGNMQGTYNGDSGENLHCLMIYQSMSGDADVGEATFTANGGSITALAGDMFYVTNTDCTITLSGVAFTPANDTFLRVEGNTSSRGWGTQGANGGSVVLNATGQAITGNLLVDDISALQLNLSNSTLQGAINPAGAGGTVDVTLTGTSTWVLTGDSNITSFTGETSAITTNGFHVYVNGSALV